MINQLTVMTYQVGDRPYNLLCAPDSPLSDLKEALFQFTKMVGDAEERLKKEAEEKLKVAEKKQE